MPLRERIRYVVVEFMQDGEHSFNTFLKSWENKVRFGSKLLKRAFLINISNFNTFFDERQISDAVLDSILSPLGPSGWMASVFERTNTIPHCFPKAHTPHVKYLKVWREKKNKSESLMTILSTRHDKDTYLFKVVSPIFWHFSFYIAHDEEEETVATHPFLLVILWADDDYWKWQSFFLSSHQFPFHSILSNQCFGKSRCDLQSEQIKISYRIQMDSSESGHGHLNWMCDGTGSNHFTSNQLMYIPICISRKRAFYDLFSLRSWNGFEWWVVFDTRDEGCLLLPI